MLKIILFIVIPLTVWGQIQVQVTDPYFKGEKLNKAGAVQVHEPLAVKNNYLPKTAQRDNFFKQFKDIEKYYQSLDSLDRDLLWFNLQKKSLEELSKIYPKISKENLKLMQNKRKDISDVKN
jgi:hypothetical protein